MLCCIVPEFLAWELSVLFYWLVLKNKWIKGSFSVCSSDSKYHVIIFRFHDFLTCFLGAEFVLWSLQESNFSCSFWTRGWDLSWQRWETARSYQYNIAPLLGMLLTVKETFFFFFNGLNGWLDSQLNSWISLFMKDTPHVCYGFERRLHASIWRLHKHLLSGYSVYFKTRMRESNALKILSLRLHIYISGLIFQSALITHRVIWRK